MGGLVPLALSDRSAILAGCRAYCSERSALSADAPFLLFRVFAPLPPPVQGKRVMRTQGISIRSRNGALYRLCIERDAWSIVK